jgi:nitrite reductase (NADH) large subunit
MPKNDHYVIIGNGPAGNAAADTLRANDKLARISIISDEMFTFYYRHKLPQFLAGAVDEDALKVRPYTVYKDNNIRMRLGQCVERIDPESRTLYLKHMEKVHYTRLLLATGGKAFVPPSLSGLHKHLTFLTRYTDALQIKPQIQAAQSILILGGDLVSLNVQQQLTRMKKTVYFALNPDSFWPLKLTPDMAARIQKNLEKKGVASCVAGDIHSITPQKNGKLEVVLDKNCAFTVDIVGCFMGLTPNIQFILGSGIDTERGVLVDDHLRTNYKDVYACGDCAQIYNPELKDYWVSIGWHNAELQGRTAALNILGDNKVIKPQKKGVLQVEGIKVNTSWWKNF